MLKNLKYNLISKKSEKDVWHRHILDSAQLLKEGPIAILPFSKNYFSFVWSLKKEFYIDNSKKINHLVKNTAGIDRKTGRTIVDIDPKYFRPSEVDFLKGNYSKAKKVLNWKPKFNIHNLVFAICSIGFDEFEENKINDLSFLKLPKGRSEVIENIPSNVIIDYAHNPEAIHNFLSSIKDHYQNLIVVFGCGGDRDKSKRSLMLKAALKSSSKVIFTSDNSRSEDFENIFADSRHLKQNHNYS